MLKNIFEWERLVHAQPTEEMVTSRQAIVNDLLTECDSQRDLSDLSRLVSSALTGLSPDIPADRSFAKRLVEFTKVHRQAFPSQLTENALDLQLTACLSVGEILSRKRAKGHWQEAVLPVAALCNSAFRIKPKATETHLEEIQEAIVGLATSHLSQKALAVRQRPEIDFSEIEGLEEPADIPTMWSTLQPFLLSAIQSLEQASTIDRDELEVLWWLYNGRSNTFDKQLKDLSPFDVALSASIELVDRALTPAPDSLNSIVDGLVVHANERTKAASKSFRAVFGSWDVSIATTLAPSDETSKAVVLESAKTLPLSWIAAKIEDSGVEGGWEAEFKAKSGIGNGVKLTAARFAAQVFAERTTQHVLADVGGN